MEYEKQKSYQTINLKNIQSKLIHIFYNSNSSKINIITLILVTVIKIVI